MIRPDDPAFPGNPKEDFSGVTVREFFAAISMQRYDGSLDAAKAAAYAVQDADALIEELNKSKDERQNNT